MLPPPFQNALVLTGPTGSGKTQLGIEIAQRLGAEIISMDSMALYRRMDIGTAKPTPEQRAAVPHHLIDVREPWESASVAWWLDEAKRCTQEIESRGKQVLFVGGTPLYLKALISGLFDGPPADDAIRQRLTLEVQTLGSETLHQRLAAIDTLSAERIHPNDVRRMIRALEVYELTGKPMSAWQTQWRGSSRQQENSGQQAAGSRQQKNSGQQAAGSRQQKNSGQQAAGSRQQDQIPDTSLHPKENSSLPAACCPLPATSSLPAILCLDLPREELYARINHRVEEMFAAGLIDEVRRLRAMERPLSPEAGQALGYKEIFGLLDGTITREETIARVQTRSRNFAKRQMGWFRHLPECRPATMELTWSLWSPRMIG